MFDSGFNDWLNFICGTQPRLVLHRRVTPIDPSNLNVASIAIGDMAGHADRHAQGDQRRRQRPRPTPRRYTGMAGITVAVSPASLTLATGETQVASPSRSRRRRAALNAYVGGQLTLDRTAAPHRAHPDGHAPGGAGGADAGQRLVQRDLRLHGPFTATARGLVPADVTAGTVADDPTDSTCSLTVAERAADSGGGPGRHDVRALLAVRRRRQRRRGPRPVRVQQRRHAGRRAAAAAPRPRRSTSLEPGGRHLHRRRPGLGRRRLDARSSCTPGCSARPTPAT